jgi:hypothetical protein
MKKTLFFSFAGENYILNIVSIRRSSCKYLEKLFRGFAYKKGKGASTINIFLNNSGTAVKLNAREKKFVKDYYKRAFSKFPFADSGDTYKFHTDNFLNNACTETIRELFRERSLLKKTLFFKSTENSAFAYNYDLKKGVLCVNSRKSVFNSIVRIKDSLSLAQAVLLSGSGGLLLHGCGIFDKGKGYVFLGISGAGKSTVASFFSPEKILSDDVLPVRAGVGGVKVFSSPFKQVGRQINIGNKNSELKAGFFLLKDNENFLSPVEKPRALVNILKHHVHYARFYNDAGLKNMFDTAGKIVEDIPFFDMHFDKECDIKTIIGGYKSV